MNIFVTGASGFVGGAITEKLKDKHRVLAMARSPVSQQKIESLGVQALRCDLSSITAEHLKDTDIVIHAAARAEDWGSYDQFYQTNVTGTQNMLKAAIESGVKRFIYVGTEAALFKGQELINIDESYPYAFDSPYPYSKSKALAEKMVLQANGPRFETISLRPRMVWGPNDQSILPAIIEMIKENSFVWVNNGAAKTSTTYIGNFVHAVELALEKGKSGEAYFITDTEISSIKNFFSQLIKTTGMDIPNRSLPSWLVRSSAYILDLTWRALNKQTQVPISRMAAAMMSRTCTLNINKARNDLAYEPHYTVKEGLKLTLQSKQV